MFRTEPCPKFTYVNKKNKQQTFSSIGFDVIFLFWHLDGASCATAVTEAHSYQISMFDKHCSGVCFRKINKYYIPT